MEKTIRLQWRSANHSAPQKKGYYLTYTYMEECPSVMLYSSPFWYSCGNKDEVNHLVQKNISSLRIIDALESVGIKTTKQQQSDIWDFLFESELDVDIVADEDSMTPDYWCELPDMLLFDDVEEIPMECHSIAATVADIVASQVSNALASSIDRLNTKNTAPWKRT